MRKSEFIRHFSQKFLEDSTKAKLLFCCKRQENVIYNAKWKIFFKKMQKKL